MNKGLIIIPPEFCGILARVLGIKMTVFTGSSIGKIFIIENSH